MRLRIAQRTRPNPKHGRPLLAALALALAAATPAKAQSCTTATVNTPAGPICGIASQGAGGTSASAFLGIRYAPQPGRWQVAQAAQPFTSTYSAVQFRNLCPQPAAASVPGCTRTAPPPQSEDCLFLNLWAPKGTTANAKLPVKVFIHGGAFIEGTGGSPLYDGTYLAATSKVIVVTLNYRLGSLGFLALEGITDSTHNNFGFRDQILALDWVNTNIPAFGGDPQNVTLWGESAGAMSVGLHALSSTQSAGLFQAALMESNPLALPYKSIAEAKTVGAQFANDAGCTGSNDKIVSCLRNKSVADLITAELQGDLTQGLSPLEGLMAWTPALDNGNWGDPLFLGQPLHGALAVPMMLGTNQDEGTLFIALMKQAQGWPSIPGYLYPLVLGKLFDSATTQQIPNYSRYACAPAALDCSQQLSNVFTDYVFSCPNRYLAVKTARTATAPNLYAYSFTQVSSFNFWSGVADCNGKVCHGDELPYVFNTPSAVCKEDKFTTAEQGLSKSMGGYWTSFDKNHAPAGNVPWSPFGSAKNTLQLAVNPKNTIDPFRALANCDFWDSVGYEGSTAWSRILARTAD